MNFLVDIGNTCIKWTLEGDAGQEPQRSFPYQQPVLAELLDEHWQSVPAPGKVLVSNVAGTEVRDILGTWVRDRWQAETRFAEVAPRSCGVTNAYQDARQLGIDRWLAMIAAWDRFKSPVCVVDCGTAMTIDAISAAGSHLGGLIIPGLMMMQEALIRNTRGIRVETSTDMNTDLGRDTQQGIANGCCLAAVALLERVMQDMNSEAKGDLHLVITGGAAEQLSPWLRVEFINDPQLVLRGLSRLFRDTP